MELQHPVRVAIQVYFSRRRQIRVQRPAQMVTGVIFPLRRPASHVTQAVPHVQTL